MSYQIIPDIGESGFQQAITLGPTLNDLRHAAGLALEGKPLEKGHLHAALDCTIRQLLPPDYPKDFNDRVEWLQSNRIEFDLTSCLLTQKNDLPLLLTGRMIWPGNPAVGWIIQIRYDTDLQHGRIKVMNADVRCLN